jgi:hypothetical protein
MKHMDFLSCAAMCFFAAEVVFLATIVALFW